MKLMIASDLHGSATYCEQMLMKFEEEKAQKLILLGDILYHGPRNNLPTGYEPRKVAELLNEKKNRILCVRGNCDSEVDQMVLGFPILADYALIESDGVVIYATHGHLDMPPMQAHDIMLSGHTHIPLCSTGDDGIIYMNPGSLSLPKNDSYRGYMTLENRHFTWKTLDGEVKNTFDA